MTAFFILVLKIIATACLLLLVYCVLFVLNALRIAVCAYLRKPIRKYYSRLCASESYITRQKIPATADIVLIATEDVSFLHHHGISIPAILCAMRENHFRRFKKADKWGGSSITQQLVKNLYLYPKKTYTRKIAEFFLAIWIELRISKRQILELYYNNVYYGRSLFGIGPASLYYLNRKPCDLSMNQLISLLCILPNPDRYNPLDHPDLFQKARAITLRRLQKYECITPKYAQKLASMPWDADSGVGELTIVKHFLTKSPCYQANLTSRESKYLDFHQNGPSGLMLHSIGCARSEPSGFLKQWNRKRFDDACVHAFIDANDGTIYQTLPWEFRAWHCGGTGNNTHIGVEMCESESIRYVGGSDFTVLDPSAAQQHACRAYEAAVRLFALLCRSYHIDFRAIISHREGCGLGIASDHKDPEHLWMGLGLNYSMDHFRTDVSTQIASEPLHIISGPPHKIKYPICKRIRGFILRI